MSTNHNPDYQDYVDAEQLESTDQTSTAVVIVKPAPLVKAEPIALRIIRAIRYNPIPMPEPEVDPRFGEMSVPEQITEVIRYNLTDALYTLSPQGSIQAFCKLCLQFLLLAAAVFAVLVCALWMTQQITLSINLLAVYAISAIGAVFIAALLVCLFVALMKGFSFIKRDPRIFAAIAIFALSAAAIAGLIWLMSVVPTEDLPRKAYQIAVGITYIASAIFGILIIYAICLLMLVGVHAMIKNSLLRTLFGIFFTLAIVIVGIGLLMHYTIIPMLDAADRAAEWGNYVNPFKWFSPSPGKEG